MRAGSRPLYAMQRMRGESMARALSGPLALADRLKLLPAVIQVAHTFACAPARGVVHRDVLGSAGHALQLRLVGADGSNRAAIGARVEVSVGDFVQTQQVDGGHGHYGTPNDLMLHVGLAGSCTATVTVRWPDAGARADAFDLSEGRYVLTQGQATPTPWEAVMDRILLRSARPGGRRRCPPIQGGQGARRLGLGRV